MQEFGGASGIAIALVVLVTVGIYVPTVIRERKLRHSERNALRLQQTIRAMAEASEAPGVIELEANTRTVRARRRELAQAQKLEVAAQREQARVEAEQRAAAAKLELERVAQEEREAKLREDVWRAAAAAREAELKHERMMAQEREAAMADATARQEAAARARAAAAVATAREAQFAATGKTAADRWANGASGSPRAIERRLTAEQPVIGVQGETAARRRRGRLASTGVGASGIIVAIVGLIIAIPFVLIAGIVVAAAAAWMLHRINEVWLATQRDTTVAEVDTLLTEPVAETAPVATAAPFTAIELDEPAAAEPEPAPGTWTPVPLPKPLYLDHEVPTESPDPDGPGGGDRFDEHLAQLLREEAIRSTEALRAAQQQVPAIGDRGGNRAEAEADQLNAERIRPITVSSDSTWAKMGDIAAIANADSASDLTDLNAVLARRRAS
ncbi:hypothetical protein [Gulosibacter bifidus]|uniref:Uncharacterized protein n=1 Tax=Gulosibacter bifidus TaxID=272239 RepID=A0ABW5RHR5_9MICO|nr:hypothetical protein [Gulosibacter bifidus]